MASQLIIIGGHTNVRANGPIIFAPHCAQLSASDNVLDAAKAALEAQGERDLNEKLADLRGQLQTLQQQVIETQLENEKARQSQHKQAIGELDNQVVGLASKVISRVLGQQKQIEFYAAIARETRQLLKEFSIPIQIHTAPGQGISVGEAFLSLGWQRGDIEIHEDPSIGAATLRFEHRAGGFELSIDGVLTAAMKHESKLIENIQLQEVLF